MHVTFLFGKPDVKRPPGGRKLAWEVTIKIHLSDIGFEEVNWICLTQDRTCGELV
jgi:hypothetical protein